MKSDNRRSYQGKGGGMNTQIKVTKKLIGKTDIRVSAGFISNGHWAIRREQVVNQTEYLPEVVTATGKGYVIEDKTVLAAIPCLNGKEAISDKFTWSQKVYVGSDAEYAIFQNQAGVEVWFKRDYIEGLALTGCVLLPSDETLQQAFVDVAKTVAIMPCKQINS